MCVNKNTKVKYKSWLSIHFNIFCPVFWPGLHQFRDWPESWGRDAGPNGHPVRPDTIQYSTDINIYFLSWFLKVQNSTEQYSTVQYRTLRYSIEQYSTVQYSTQQYSTVQYSTLHYIILNNGILKSNSSIFPRSEGNITQYTP